MRGSSDDTTVFGTTAASDILALLCAPTCSQAAFNVWRLECSGMNGRACALQVRPGELK